MSTKSFIEKVIRDAKEYEEKHGLSESQVDQKPDPHCPCTYDETGTVYTCPEHIEGIPKVSDTTKREFPEITITDTGIGQTINDIQQEIKMCIIAKKGAVVLTGDFNKAVLVEEHTAILAEKDKRIEVLERLELAAYDSIARTTQDSTITAPLREYFKNKKALSGGEG